MLPILPMIYLADAAAAAPPDTLISGNWLILIVGAIITAAGGVWLRSVSLQQGRAENLTLSEPGPSLPVRKYSTPPSYDQHRALADRVERLEHTTQEIRRDLAIQYKELLVAGGEREMRITEKLDGIARGIHSRIDEHLKSCSDRQCPPSLHPTRK